MFNLSIDVLEVILDKVAEEDESEEDYDPTNALLAYCLVSKAFQAIVQKRIYREVKVYSVLNLMRLFQTLQAHPLIARMVRTVDINMPFTHEQSLTATAVNDLVRSGWASMTKLECIYIQWPHAPACLITSLVPHPLVHTMRLSTLGKPSRLQPELEWISRHIGLRSLSWPGNLPSRKETFGENDKAWSVIRGHLLQLQHIQTIPKFAKHFVCERPVTAAELSQPFPEFGVGPEKQDRLWRHLARSSGPLLSLIVELDPVEPGTLGALAERLPTLQKLTIGLAMEAKDGLPWLEASVSGVIKFTEIKRLKVDFYSSFLDKAAIGRVNDLREVIARFCPTLCEVVFGNILRLPTGRFGTTIDGSISYVRVSSAVWQARYDPEWAWRLQDDLDEDAVELMEAD